MNLTDERAPLLPGRPAAAADRERARRPGRAARGRPRARASPSRIATGCSCPFQRLGDTDNTTGVGLGLALSRGLTEAMGGTLEPEETPGGGLTMVAVAARGPVPADPGRGDPAQRERSEAPRRRSARRTAAEGWQAGHVTRVLVVDDEPQILRALRINLRVRGYEVDTRGHRRRGAGDGRPRTRRTW